MRLVLGIDPGLSGAMALLDPRGSGELLDAWDLPVLAVGRKRELDEQAINRQLRSLRDQHPILAVIEDVHAMPKQGVSSSFRFGYGYGVLRGALAALEIPYELVTPQRWKRSVLTGLPKEKDAARAFVRRRWPEKADVFARVKDHGRADATCIALWAARHAAEGWAIPVTGGMEREPWTLSGC